MTILVRMPNWLGDVVMALPALCGVREACPGARVVAVTASPFVPLLEGMADDTIVLERGWAVRADIRRVAAEAADRGLLLTSSFSSALLFRLAGVSRLIGYRTEARGLIGVHGPAYAKKGHLTEQYAALVDLLGPWRRDLTPRLPAAARWGEAVSARLAEFGLDQAPRIVILPGAAFGPAKRWPLARFAEVARALGREGGSLSIAGTHGERPLALELARAAGLSEDAVSAGRTNLIELAGLLSHADLVLANDSGALHLAAACGAAVVGVFGSTDPSWTAPARGTVVRRPVVCSPCFRRTCDIGTPCLTGVSAEEVTRACVGILERKGGGRRQFLSTNG